MQNLYNYSLIKILFIMKEKVQAVLRLMEVMGVTIKDLQIYDDSIENTKKFPLELYYNDGTRSLMLTTRKEPIAIPSE